MKNISTFKLLPFALFLLTFLACSDGESGNASSLANALAGKTFDLDLDTTSSSCSGGSGTDTGSAADETAPVTYPADTAYPSDAASDTEGTFLVKHTHETAEENSATDSDVVEPASQIEGKPASYTITFTNSTYTIKSGSTVVETGTWKAIDGNTAEVKSDGVTTRVNVDIDGETLYVSTTASDCSSTTDVSQPAENAGTADDSTNDADYYYYADDFNNNENTSAPTITENAWDSY